MNPVRDILVKQGYRIEMPLLAGHGGTFDDLVRTKWQDWYKSLRNAYENLRREVDRIYYAGLSLGALLGLKLAADEGWGVRAMALLGTPMKLVFKSRVKFHLANYSPLRWIIDAETKDFEEAVARPEGRELCRALALDRMPLASVRELVSLQGVVRNSLSHVANPLLVIYGAQDVVTPPWNADVIKAGVTSDVVEIIKYSRSRHVITLDWDGDEAARRIAEFFKRFS
jgi:carboxylesterase